jgi:hypothetical protein
MIFQCARKAHLPAHSAIEPIDIDIWATMTAIFIAPPDVTDEGLGSYN